MKGSTIWITGATGGFGRELALRCARDGSRLALSARSKDKLEQLAGECKAAGSPQALALALDVRDDRAIDETVKAIARDLGRIDGFVASAADVPLGNLESLTNDEWTYGIENKLLGTVYCLRAVLPVMRAQKSGRVVVLSGSRGTEPMAKSLLPGAVNAALNNVKGLSREYAPFGIAINTVSPSLVMTARGELYIRTEAAKAGRAEAEVRADWTRDLPAGRFIDTEEIVDVLYELVCSFPIAFSGQTVLVDAAESRGVR
jgi:NAD(P)-dependent dehydrogenase (short-subunit alcohol dehydrogenase family)